MTLSAENDFPRRVLFPIGRFFSTLRQGTVSREQRRAIHTALGIYEPQITHNLHLETPIPEREAESVEGKCGVDLRLQPKEADQFRRGELGDIRKSGGNIESYLLQLPMSAKQSIYGSLLEPKPGIDPNSPFLVVEASKDLIDGHVGLFNPG